MLPDMLPAGGEPSLMRINPGSGATAEMLPILPRASSGRVPGARSPRPFSGGQWSLPSAFRVVRTRARRRMPAASTAAPGADDGGAVETRESAILNKTVSVSDTPRGRFRTTRVASLTIEAAIDENGAARHPIRRSRMRCCSGSTYLLREDILHGDREAPGRMNVCCGPCLPSDTGDLMAVGMIEQRSAVRGERRRRGRRGRLVPCRPSPARSNAWTS
jgi:hypothetical protein